MALFVAKNGQLQTIKGIYYGMNEDYINATLFHNLVPKTATEIRFLYASNNPDLTDYQKLGYCDNNNFIEVWNSGTKYIIINPRKNYIYAPISCKSFLSNYTALTDCVFNNFDTRYVTDMSSMFKGCSSLTGLDLSSFNTQNVNNLSYFANYCTSLKILDLSSFNTENVTDMSYMFSHCALISLNLRGFTTEKVTNMNHMFIACSSLQSIFSNTFSTLSLNYSISMFYQCFNLVGGNGTTYAGSHISAQYAHVDGENGLPGYFTAPN